MKKITHTMLITMLICGILLPVSMPYSLAHAPLSVSMSYNADTQDLTVHIIHTVGDPSTHYVYSVSVTINSELNATHTYTSQPDATEFDYVYPLTLVEGDVVSITASCNQGGSNAGTLTYSLTSDDEPSDDVPTDDDDTPTIPGYTLVTVMVSISTLVMIFAYKTRSRRL